MHAIIKQYTESGHYSSNWGLSDFYDDLAGAIVEAVNAHAPFSIHLSAKKEIQYGWLDYDGQAFSGYASAQMDDAADLCDTMLWELAKDNKITGYPRYDECRDSSGFAVYQHMVSLSGETITDEEMEDRWEEFVDSFLESTDELHCEDYVSNQYTFAYNPDVFRLEALQREIDLAIQKAEAELQQTYEDAKKSLLSFLVYRSENGK